MQKSYNEKELINKVSDKFELKPKKVIEIPSSLISTLNHETIFYLKELKKHKYCIQYVID